LNVLRQNRGLLDLKPNFEERAIAASRLGADKFWSSENLVRHLAVLNSVVPCVNEAGARAWIDAFFFRVSAMVPSAKCMILNMEQSVVHRSTSAAFSGTINYTVVIADRTDARCFLLEPYLSTIKEGMPSAFFVAEAKSSELKLVSHIPQATSEMYACLEDLEKDVLRGALTNGQDWIFLIMNRTYDNNGQPNGARYRHSHPFVHEYLYQRRIERWYDVVAGILLYWIEHSFVDLTDDDWFDVSVQDGQNT